MKHTMKKLLCMALAIMLLVSAVPVFAAAADDITVIVKLGDTETDRFSFEPDNKTTANVGNILNYHIQREGRVPADATSKSPELIWSSNMQSYVGTDADVSVGDTVTFKFAKKTNNDNENDTDKDTDKDSTPIYSVKINVKLNGTEQGWYTTTIKNSTTTVANLINVNNGKIDANLIKGYTFDTAYVRNTNTYLQEDGTVNSGDEIYIAFKKDVAPVSPINIVVKVDGSDNVVWTGSKVPADGVSSKVADLLSYCWNSDWDDVYTFDHAWSHDQQKNVAKTGSINAGDTVYIMLTKGGSSSGGSPSTTGKLELTIRVNGTKKYDNDVKNFTSATVASVIKNVFDSDWTSKYAFDKVEVNDVTYGRSDLEVRAGDEVDIYLTRKYSKDNSNKVYLHVYLNGDASTIAMTKDITGTYLMDDWKTDTTEILNYLKNNYYTAKDSSNAITIDGLYVSTDTKGAFPSNYYNDNRTPSKDGIDELLEDGYVHISVMLKNAKAKSSSTADSSNPKTGDTIFVPVMVMGVTGTVLAAAYVFGKKRFAR